MHPANMPSILAVELFSGAASPLAIRFRHPGLWLGDVLAIVLAFLHNPIGAVRWRA